MNRLNNLQQFVIIFYKMRYRLLAWTTPLEIPFSLRTISITLKLKKKKKKEKEKKKREAFVKWKLASRDIPL